MINTTIGKYKITRLIGEGGMASVYEAEHEILETQVAIKVLNPVLSTNAQIRERFKNEAKMMAAFKHPNITKIIDFDDQPHQLSIVMEFLDGEDLNEKIKRNGPLSQDAIKDIFAQTLSAFQYAHEKGVVHRDIKPSNIYVLPNGHVKILDFGIAKLFGQGNEMTQTGTQIGTPIYMSPEQVKADKSIDHRSDIYSLGVTMFYAITGKPPYNSDTTSQFDIFNKIVFEPLPELPDIGNLDDFVKKACQKDRDLRFQSCEEWLNKLNNSVPSGANATTDKNKTVIANMSHNDAPEAKNNDSNNQKKEGGKSTKKRKWLMPVIISALVLIAGAIIIFYALENKDSDGDGVVDKYDYCILEKGDVNGCPDKDNDGTPDYSDNCPGEYSLNNQGCPDSDNDGIIDKDDACPEVAGNNPNGCFYFNEVTFTNKSKYKAILSIAYNNENGWKCKGWYTINPKESWTYTLPEKFDGKEVYWTANSPDGVEWKGKDLFLNVELNGSSGFETKDGKLIKTGGGYLEKWGFHKLVLTNETTYHYLRN